MIPKYHRPSKGTPRKEAMKYSIVKRPAGWSAITRHSSGIVTNHSIGYFKTAEACVAYCERMMSIGFWGRGEIEIEDSGDIPRYGLTV